MFPRARILIVDDEPRMSESIRVLLSSQNYEIHTVNSGQAEYVNENGTPMFIN